MRKLQVIGNIVRDAEIRETNGRKAINFTVAVNENYKNADGVKVEKAFFYSCTLWRDASKSTEVVKYLSKGIKVMVEGKPDAIMYKTKDNQTAIDHKLTVNDLEILTFKDKEEGQGETKTEAPEMAVSANDDLPF